MIIRGDNMVKCLVYKNVQKKDLQDGYTYIGYKYKFDNNYIKYKLIWNEKFQCFQDIDNPVDVNSLHIYEDFDLILSINDCGTMMNIDEDIS